MWSLQENLARLAANQSEHTIIISSHIIINNYGEIKEHYYKINNIMPSVSKLPLTFLLICFAIQSYDPQSVIVIVVFQALNLILVAFTTSK